MSAAFTDYQLPLIHYAGSTTNYSFKDQDGAVLPLSGYDFEYTIRDVDGTSKLNLTVGSGITVDTVTGVVSVEITALQAIPATFAVLTTYYSDLRVIPGTGQPSYPPARWVITFTTPNARP